MKKSFLTFPLKSNKNQIDSLKKEKEIFGLVSNEFVVKAMFTFAHETYICFVMEYMRGGDLSSLLEKYYVFHEPMARFYICELISAVEYLHNMGIIHRDLKPDNLLIDSKGRREINHLMSKSKILLIF